MREQYLKDEPDRISWIDQETGYDCLILRQENEIKLD